MFDVAFSEIVVIVLVALVVIGPEKLPAVARTLGRLAGKLQRYASTVKAEIDRELRLEEIRRMEQETRHSILSVESQVNEEVHKTTSEISQMADTPHRTSPHE